MFVSLLGQISLDGLTIEASTEVLRRQFNQFLVDPEVRVILSAPRAAQVTVSGAVLRPGYFPISPNAFVHEALLTAGGASVNSDLKNVIVQRRRADGSVISQSIDLYTPIAEGTPLPNIRLRDGDTIVVPERDLLFDSDYDRELLRRTPLVTAQDTPIRFAVIGEVETPGYYEANSALPYFVEDALVIAQGSKSTADLRSVLVQRPLRDGTMIEQEVDLYTPLISGGTLPPLHLEDGDVVIVPKLALEDLESYNNEILASSNITSPVITVRLFSRALGRVTPVTLENGSRLTDVLAQVPLQDSIVSRIAIVRFDEARGEAVTEHYDGWAAIEGDETENVLLRDKDVILVGRNTIASISNVLNRFTQPFRDILGFLLFFDQLENSASNLFSPN
ncbi:MAG: polysaccharide export protein, partial [Coleofasciculaceae cyanobacterium RL_1_1]|nr:polysaccharide export protein [Coleofasciculaceae cyanobacterium RL_1_1]